MQISTYLKDALAQQVLRDQSVFLALFTSDPTQEATGIEVSGGNYLRQAVTFGAPVDGICTSTVTVSFPIATFTWGTVTHAALFDAVSNGNMLFFGELPEPKTIAQTDQLLFGAGNVSAGFE